MGIRTKEEKCACCGETLNDTTCTEDGVTSPRAGDVSVCLYCGNLMIFTKDGGRRDMTEAEREEIMEDPRSGAILKARREVMKDRLQ